VVTVEKLGVVRGHQAIIVYATALQNVDSFCLVCFKRVTMAVVVVVIVVIICQSLLGEAQLLALHTLCVHIPIDPL